MKRILTTLAAGIICAALTFGQGPRMNATTGSSNGAGTQTPPDPATIIGNRVSYLTTLLSLTDTQKTEATTIFTNEFNSAQTVLTNLQAAQTALGTAIKNNDSAGIDQAATTIGNLTAQLTSIHAKAEAAFYALLTSDQQAKYNLLPQHGGPGGHGGFGGPGGPHP